MKMVSQQKSINSDVKKNMNSKFKMKHISMKKFKWIKLYETNGKQIACDNEKKRRQKIR